MKKSIIAFIFLLAVPVAGRCTGSTPLIHDYLDAIKQLGKHCTMSYTTTCTFPDKTNMLVSGKMAIRANDYYDSSNARFVLMNSSWLILADHKEEQVNIVDLAAWKKKMGKGYEMDISGYLLNDAALENFSGFKVNPSGPDSFTVSVHYNLDNGQVIDLLLQYPKGSKVPSRYEGTIQYALDEPGEDNNGEQPDLIHMRFECHDISPVVDAALFDDRRLVSVKGGKATIKRYNNYKIYRKAA